MSTDSRQGLLDHCARMMLEGGKPGHPAEPAQAFLKALGYDGILDLPMLDEARLHCGRLLRAAAGFSRLFQLRSPDAPGLVFYGAQADPSGILPGGRGQGLIPASGAGTSLRAAFEGCVGEAVELLSQFDGGDETLVQATPDQAEAGQAEAGYAAAMVTETRDLLARAGRRADTTLDWISARALAGGPARLFPADACLRRGEGRLLQPSWPLSLGCAAGLSFEAAALHGLLELIERDAAALWWRGGARGHLIPLEHEASRQGLRTLEAVRRGSARRRTWLLDITSDLAIPCVAALSVNPGGDGFACGLAARLSLAAAVQAALLELGQMELAHHVVEAKRREAGEPALNALDLRHVRRARELDVHRCALLHPLPPRDIIGGETIDESGGTEAGLAQLTAHLLARGIEPFVIDLTRPAFGIPVVRVLCPALEKEPSDTVGPRLAAAMRDTGGGAAHTGGVPLM